MIEDDDETHVQYLLSVSNDKDVVTLTVILLDKNSMAKSICPDEYMEAIISFYNDNITDVKALFEGLTPIDELDGFGDRMQ